MAVDHHICREDDCDNPSRARGWCEMHYGRWRRMGEWTPNKGRTAPEAKTLTFLKSVVENPPNECVLWPFALSKAGYGRVQYQGDSVRAHRVSLMLFSGPPNDDSLYAAHTPVICHNRSCVNPKHLRWATPLENVRDKRKDGTQHRGTDVGIAKLNEDQVLAIRASDETRSEMAKRYGVTRSTIAAIQKRKSWKWLKS